MSNVIDPSAGAGRHRLQLEAEAWAKGYHSLSEISGGRSIGVKYILGQPVVPFYPFLGEGSLININYRKKGTLILTSPLEDLALGTLW